MIKARKIQWLERPFLWGVRHAMRRRFYGVYVRGWQHIEQASASARPLVICANHSNWWDGFSAALLLPFFPGRRLYLAQSEDLLKLYRPFRWLGVFGLDIHGSPLAGLRYALELLLGDSRVAIWLFPQGVLVPQWLPIKVKPGAFWLARRSGALVLPMAFRYEWMVESRPSLFICCGEPLEPDASDETLARTMQALFDSVGSTLLPVDLSGYRCLFKPRRSMNKVWERATRSGPVNPRNE